MDLRSSLEFFVSSDDSSDDDDDDVRSGSAIMYRIFDEDEEELNINDYRVIQRAVHRSKRRRISTYLSKVVDVYMEDDFMMHFRFPRAKTELLVARFAAWAPFQKILASPGREAISAKRHILSYLWFAGHMSVEYRDVADRFDMTLSTLFAVITRVNKFLISLSNVTIRFPNTEEEKQAIQDGFLRTGTKLTNVMGAIDGSHIHIDRPKEDSISYLNRKKCYSVHLQGVCDHRAKFMHVLVGYPGSVHDARVYKESTVPQKLNEFCNVGTYILGDSAYPLSNNLLTPYRNHGHVSNAQHNFNHELSKARITIEHVFGQLKQRFRQLYFLKLRSPVRRVEFIHAVCVLHNLGSKEDLDMLEPPMQEVVDGNMIEEVVLQAPDVSAENFRDGLCDEVATVTPANVMQIRADSARRRRL